MLNMYPTPLRKLPTESATQIHVLDTPSHGGANHLYAIVKPSSNTAHDGFAPQTTLAQITFQMGPVQEAGVNGITEDQLLAILIDRLTSFQEGPYRCRENAIALTKLEEAAHWLQHRTKAREARGVEGTSTA
jgi:hypothetical protein